MKAGMLVKVDLSEFFDDHRSKALLFLHQNAQIVEDFENHIKTIFDIENFYLSQNEFHLPSAEDITIIKNIDIVKVRSTGSSSGTPKKRKARKETAENEVSFYCKKKRHREESTCTDDKQTCEESALDQSTPESDRLLTKKKNKKVRYESSSNSNNESGISLETKENGESPGDSDQAELVRKIISNRKDSGCRVKSYVENYENKLVMGSPRPIIKNFVPLNRLGKVNIVKTIIVNNKLNKSNALNIKNNKEIEKKLIETADNIKETNEETGNKTNNKVNEVKNESDFSLVSCMSAEDGKKKKRKRVRKRKKRAPQEIEAPVVEVQQNSSDPQIKPSINIISNLHLRFENKETEENKESNNSNETIEVSENKTCLTNGNKDQVVETINNVDENLCEEERSLFFTEEFIMKQPLLKTLPKQGDFISFKIYRLSENYTPEISSFIIGKVLTVNEETNEVSVYIVCGLEQCNQPQGVLTLEQEDTEAASNVTGFTWKEMLEPRLLSPEIYSISDFF